VQAYGSGMQQGVIRSLNLSLVVAFMSLTTLQLPMILFDLRRTIHLQVGNPTALAFNTPCTFPNADGPGNFTTHCHERLSLPPYSSSCLAAWSLDYDNEYACEFVPANSHKFVAATLPQTAPRVHALTQAMSFTSDDAVRPHSAAVCLA